MTANARALAAVVLDEPQAYEPTEGQKHLREKVLRRDQLALLPRPEPLIEDTLDQRTTAVLSGRNSSGKSFIALDWSCCIATGKAWQGRPVLDQGPVLYIAAEGAHGLHQRVTAWEQAWHRKVDDLDVLPLPVNLFTGARVSDLLDIVRERAYRLVVIDTWARSTVGGRENDNSDSTAAYERVDQIRRLGSTVLVVAHTDAGDTKTRGATALDDNSDTIYRAAGDAQMLKLERTKRKDGPCEDALTLALRTVQIQGLSGTFDGTSCVVESAVEDRGQMTPKAGELGATFADMFADTGASKAELRAVADQAPATFARSVNALVKAGFLINTATDQRPFYRLGSTDAHT